MSERWWKQSQTINDLYDAEVPLGFYADHVRFNRAFRIHGLFAARHLRRAGNFKAAAEAVRFSDMADNDAEKLPRVWQERVARERRLIEARSRAEDFL